MTVFMTYLMYSVIGAVLILITCWCIGRYKLVHQYRKMGQVSQRSHPTGWIITGLVTFAVGFFCLFNVFQIWNTANIYGATAEHYTKMKMSNFKYSVAHSSKAKYPKVQDIKHNKNSLFVLYRFGCSDCHRLNKDINKAFPESAKNVYYVPSRSELGKKLVKAGSVDTVPTLVYVNRQGKVYSANLMNTARSFNKSNAHYYHAYMEK